VIDMAAEVPDWVLLDGGANARDVGGLPTEDGGSTRSGALIRSANLQHLTPADLDRLVIDLGVRCVVDLRTDVEVAAEGPGPITHLDDVTVHHLSLFPEAAHTADRIDPSPESQQDDSQPDKLLPWHDRGRPPRITGVPVADLYLTYLEQRPDSVVSALRAIASAEGAVLVHCAAGKDRTGVVIALALALVGVRRSAIVRDYAATESQIGAIVALLSRTPTYQREVADPAAIPAPTAAVMTAVLTALDSNDGGIAGWLGTHGWTAADTARLRSKLLSR
jgi:protein-tyrosine phosphatase